jgi:hypothetical protein
MRALLQLDLHFLRNQLREIVRSPLRLAIWIPYIGLVIGLGAWRVVLGRNSAPSDLSGLPPQFATLAGATYLAALGFAFARHAGGRVRAFRCEAEALLCVNAGIAPLLLTLWLQLRKLCGSTFRWFGALALYVSALAPPGAPAVVLARVVFASVLAAVALATLEIPAYLIGRRKAAPVLIALAWGLTAYGGLAAVAAAAEILGDRGFAPILLRALGFDPGAGVTALVAGRGWAFAALAALALAPALAIVVLGRDALPELYEATLHGKLTAPSFARAAGLAHRARLGRNIPGGTLALFWKEWIVLRRRGGGGRLVWSALFWGAFGGGIAFALGPAGDPELGLVLLSIATLFVALVPVVLSNGLGEDLCKPLWWLATATMSSRLAAWTFSRSWPGGAALAALPLVLGLALRQPLLVLLALPGSLLLWWSMHALGLALVAIFPSGFDMRGPVGILRMAIAGAYLLLPLGVCTTVLTATANAVLAGCVAAGLFWLQGYAAVRAAAFTLDRNGALIGTLERSG